MAANSKKTPTDEYSKVSVTLILVFYDGSELPLENRFESLTFSPNPDNGTLPGSGSKPRAHRETTYAPELTIVVDVDMGEHIVNRAGRRGVKQVKIIRQRPEGIPVTNLIEHWKVSPGDEEFGDDPSTMELTGNALDFTFDKTKKIVIS